MRACSNACAKYFVGKSVNLYIHLAGSDTVFCSGYFKVHIAEVIFVTEDIGEDSDTFLFWYQQ